MAIVSLDQFRQQKQQYAPVDPKFGDRSKLLTDVLDEFEASRNFLRPYFDRFLRYYRLYRAFTPAKQRSWRANVFVPIPFASVEHGVAVTMEAYSQRPMNYVLPREGNDYHGAKVMEMYLEWEDDDMAILSELHDASKEMLLYGTAWGKVMWDWERQRNQVEGISVFNGYPDPNAEGMKDSEFFIHRSLRSPNYAKRLARAGILDITEEKIDQIAGMSWGQTLESEQLLGQVDLEGRSHDRPGKRIEFLERWTPESVTTVLNRQEVVRSRPNRFPHGQMPFFRFVDHAVPHEIMGIGELEVAEKLFEEINDIRNQRLDIVSQAINNVIVANRQAGIDADSLIMRPGQIIWANSVEAVKPLIQIGPNGGPALGVAEEGMARFDIQEATGNWGYNQGQVPNRREAATTVLALQRAAGIRFTSKLRYNEVGALRPMAEMRMKNAQKFLPPQRWIRITNQMPVPIDREDIQGVFDYIPVVSSSEPRDQKRAQWGQLFPILATNPRINDAKLIEFTLDLYNVREKEFFLLTDEQMQQKMMMAAQVQAAAKATGQGGAPGGVASPDLGIGGGAGALPGSVGGIALSSQDRGMVSSMVDQGAGG